MEASSQIVDIVIDLRSLAANNRQIGREDTAMTISQRDRDLGTGYALRSPATRTELTSVGRGTPMGELLRRYWHPVGLVSNANDIPRKVRVLGEDLILFRDRLGRVGLLHADEHPEVVGERLVALVSSGRRPHADNFSR